MNLEITSRENKKYKEIKNLITKKSNDCFLIEGFKLLEEGLKSNISIKEIIIDKNNLQTFKDLLKKNNSSIENSKLNLIKNNLLSSLYTTDKEPTSELLAITIAHRPNYQTEDIFSTKKNVVLLESIQDPGNLGTIIRSALAFNAGGILLTKDSTNPYSTKVIRASAGAIFKMPVVYIDTDTLKKFALKYRYTIIGTSSKSKKSISSIDSYPKVFLFGNEGKGLSSFLEKSAEEIIKIPHSSNVESLNLGVAVSIVLWETQKKET